MFNARQLRPIQWAIVLTLTWCAAARAQCTPDWIGGEAFPGVNGGVGASLTWAPTGGTPVLVVAGDFTIAGALAVQRIAAWDGTSWGDPFHSGFDGPVHALAVWNGDLIAGGQFTHAGGAPAAGLARWDGAAWQPLGGGVDGGVYTLAEFDGKLYAGGSFANAGGLPAANLAAWDGASWSAAGTGVDGAVYALASFNGSLYAGGQFANAGGVPAADIASWNGTAWSALTSGISVAAADAPAQVRSLLVDGGALYIAGIFDHAGGLTAYSVARWNGMAWMLAGAGVYRHTCIRYVCHNYPYKVYALGKFGTTIYAAAGPSLVYAFNGSSWVSSTTSTAATSGEWPIATVAELNGKLYLGGSFGGTGAPANFAVLNGSAWALIGGMDGGVNGLAAYMGQLVAAGTFTQIDGSSLSRVASWDGSAWHAIGSGLTAPAYGAAAAGNNLYVTAWPGGVLQWDGAAWTTLYGAGTFGGPPRIWSWNGQVIAGFGGAVFGGDGEESDPSAVGTWNGTAWVPVGTVSWVASGRTPFANLGNALYVAGYFGGATVGRSTGNGFQAVGTGTLGTAVALAANNGSVYASMIAPDNTGLVAVLSGGDWQQIGGVFDSAPDLLASANGVLFASGPFTMIDGAPFAGIARWDGAAWQPVGAGVSGGIAALADFGGNLIAGGAFDAAGGRGYARFAVYGCPALCYANCDGSTLPPVLNANDFQCFLNAFAAADPYANCDGSTIAPVLNANDFQCFLNKYAEGCP